MKKPGMISKSNKKFHEFEYAGVSMLLTFGMAGISMVDVFLNANELKKSSKHKLRRSPDITICL